MRLHAEQYVVVLNRHSEPLHTTVTTADAGRAPIVVIMHGFKGFRNYSFLPLLAQVAATRGMHAVRFCFSRNGMANTSWMVQDAAAFARNTISHEVNDALDLIAAIQHNTLFAHLRERWNGQVYLVGHSRGGGVAQVVSRELLQSGSHLLCKTLCLNSVGSWERWTPRQREAWQRAGSMMVTNQRTGQELPMEFSYVEDIELNADRLSLPAALRAAVGYIAFVHAAEDITVPLREVNTLIEQAGTASPLITIPNTTHTFGMTHPVERITHGFTQAIEEGFSWLG